MGQTVSVRPRPPGHPRVRVLAAVAVCAALAAVVPVGVLRWTERERPSSPANAADAPSGGSGPIGTCAGRPLSAPRELRGMWLTTVYNIDWPSKPGLDEAVVKSEYLGWLDLAQRLNLNAIFVHVRPSGDALWPSEYAPWSNWLTGRLDGQSPGWDPLEFIIAEAHKRDLEFHAWFNPYRGTQPAPRGGAGADFTKLATNHPLRHHPEWAVTYPAKSSASRLYFNPGIPEARRFVEDAMLEAVKRYDVDGVHFDDFFYPYPEERQDFNDAAAFATYGAGFKSKADWRRDNVNKLVQEMNQRVKEIKPWVKFGISPFGIWRNARTDSKGSPTSGLQSYDEIYADTRLWVQKEWLDYIVPQLYWHIGFEVADYAKLLPWWSKLVAGTHVQLYIGMADWRVGEKGAWRDPAELDRQHALNKKYKVQGTAHFAAVDLREDPLGAVTRYRNKHYASPALIPTMAHIPGAKPAAPTLTGARRGDGGAVTLHWRPSKDPAATSYAIYRIDSAPANGTAKAPPAQIVGTTRGSGDGDQTFVDRSAKSDRTYTYCVTALDRLWNEGAASAPQQVT